MIMRLELYCSEGELVEAPENRGYRPLQIAALLSRLRDGKGLDYTIQDVAAWGRDSVARAYERAVIASYTNRYAIRKVFGTNSSSGVFFGRGVPALIVYDEGDRPVHVFPHEERGDLVTICDYLETLLGDDAAGLRLANAMDELMREIGPIGAPTSDLVHEGRRR